MGYNQGMIRSTDEEVFRHDHSYSLNISRNVPDDVSPPKNTRNCMDIYCDSELRNEAEFYRIIQMYGGLFTFGWLSEGPVPRLP